MSDSISRLKAMACARKQQRAGFLSMRACISSWLFSSRVVVLTFVVLRRGRNLYHQQYQYCINDNMSLRNDNSATSEATSIGGEK